MNDENMSGKSNPDNGCAQNMHRALHLDSLSSAVIVCDIFGNIQYFNASAKRLLTCIDIPYPNRRLPELFDLIDDATGQTTVNPVLACLQRSGNNGRFSGNAILYGEPGGQIVGLTATLVRNLQKQIIGIAFELHPHQPQ